MCPYACAVRQERMRERYAPELAWVIHHVVQRQHTLWLNNFRWRQAKHCDMGSHGAFSSPDCIQFCLPPGPSVLRL